MAFFTNTGHNKPYPAISPTLPALSQAGKSVLITGGSTGIGYAIAVAFAHASASTIIITGRRTELLQNAASQLTKEVPGFKGRLLLRTCDVSDMQDTDLLWSELERKGITVDVLVINAARLETKGPLLQSSLIDAWAEFQTNVRGNLDFVQHFNKLNERFPNGTKKSLVNVSSVAIHDFGAPGNQPNYNLTKNSGALVFQQVARDTPSDKMQIVSFHPGAIFSDTAKALGYNENSMAWDDVNLPGHFAVWAASPEAQFLHGRFVWARWDVEELRTGEIRKHIDSDPNYLKIGVIGL